MSGRRFLIIMRPGLELEMTRTQQKDLNSLPSKGRGLRPAVGGHSLRFETLSCSSFSDPHVSCLPAMISSTSPPLPDLPGSLFLPALSYPHFLAVPS